MIEVKDLYKNYYSKKSGKFAGIGKIPTIGDESNSVPLQGLGVSFDVNRGEIFGIIGPDGAGKTTLFRILTTLILPDSGIATVNGFDVVKDYKKIRECVGYMPGRFSLYQDLTVEENLEFFATVFNTTIEENYELIKDIYIQIEPFKKRRAGKLSGGMKQKLALSCALIHKPTVLFLDEPTTGVDPVSRKEFWEMLQKLKKEGITILVSTPYMDEASLCDRIALIQNGQFLKIDTPDNIVNQFANNLWAAKSTKMHKLLEDLRENKQVNSAFAFGDSVHLTVSPQNPDFTRTLSQGEGASGDFKSLSVEELTDYLKQKGHKNIEIKPIEPTIEDCFMELSQTK